MPRVTDTNGEPAKPRVYEVVIEYLQPLKKGGWKKLYSHTIKKDGWEDFFEED